MPHPLLRIDSTPREAARLPFASEMGLQEFIENHAKVILGLDVIASAQRGGGRLFDIDILAADKAGTPVIIECKWDSVGHGALRQLGRYREALRSNWARVEQSANARSILVRNTEPLLVTVGYRYLLTPAIPAPSVLCLSYTYHGIVFTNGRVQEQSPGRVSIIRGGSLAAGRHPKVSKQLAIVERLDRCSRELTRPFLEINEALSDTVSITYSGKNFVNYAASDGVVAKAVIDFGLIRWHVRALASPVEMRSATDAVAILTVLQAAFR